MRSLRPRLRAGGWMAVGAVAGGLLVGGAWYASAHDLTTGLLDASAGRGSIVAQAVPNYPAGPTPTVNPSIAQYPAPAPKPAQPNSRRPSGEVTQIAANPAAFTIRTPAGALMTFEVLNTTVFMVGHDRPYRFDLLKQGDEVTVRDGPDKVPVPNASPVPAGGKTR